MTALNVKNDGSVQVPLLDLKAQYATIEQEIRAAIDEVLKSQHFILGQNVKTLEERIADYSECEFGVGVSSGTDALLLALMAIGVSAGDEIITTPYSFFATAGVVSRLGATPVFCDIDPISYNLAPAAVERFISENCERQGEKLVNRSTGATVKALLPVHLYGQCADMDPLLAIARDWGLRVIEDAAQAIGSEYHGRRAGSMGDIGCFSFFPSKNLGAFGDAGMCTTRDAELAERMRILRVHGSKPKYYHALVGGNFRLDELQAAVLLVKLQYLDAWSAARQANAERYTEALDQQPVTTPQALPGYRHIYNQYVLRVEQRDKLREHLSAANIGTEIYYPIPLHMQECFAHLGYRPDDCPESARAAVETLALPVYPELSSEQLEYTVESISEFYR